MTRPIPSQVSVGSTKRRVGVVGLAEVEVLGPRLGQQPQLPHRAPEPHGQTLAARLQLLPRLLLPVLPQGRRERQHLRERARGQLGRAEPARPGAVVDDAGEHQPELLGTTTEGEVQDLQAAERHRRGEPRVPHRAEDQESLRRAGLAPDDPATVTVRLERQDRGRRVAQHAVAGAPRRRPARSRSLPGESVDPGQGQLATHVGGAAEDRHRVVRHHLRRQPHGVRPRARSAASRVTVRVARTSPPRPVADSSRVDQPPGDGVDARHAPAAPPRPSGCRTPAPSTLARRAALRPSQAVAVGRLEAKGQGRHRRALGLQQRQVRQTVGAPAHAVHPGPGDLPVGAGPRLPERRPRQHHLERPRQLRHPHPQQQRLLGLPPRHQALLARRLPLVSGQHLAGIGDPLAGHLDLLEGRGAGRGGGSPPAGPRSGRAGTVTTTAPSRASTWSGAIRRFRASVTAPYQPPARRTGPPANPRGRPTTVARSAPRSAVGSAPAGPTRRLVLGQQPGERARPTRGSGSGTSAADAPRASTRTASAASVGRQNQGQPGKLVRGRHPPPPGPAPGRGPPHPGTDGWRPAAARRPAATTGAPRGRQRHDALQPRLVGPASRHRHQVAGGRGRRRRRPGVTTAQSDGPCRGSASTGGRVAARSRTEASTAQCSARHHLAGLARRTAGCSRPA